LNGLRPTKEEMTILSVFSQLISLILINSKKYHEAVDLADSDGLTGLYNHTRLYKDIEFYEKTNEKIALIFFDIDNFKNLNDKKGHVYGDSILKAISAIFKENIRPEDRAYRYGGDEFVIILKDVNKFFSYEIIKRIIKITENLYPEITFSAGISDTYEIKKYKELINLSDERVYISKNTGKGKIIIK
ncbi:MAG TPA: GGDEF domain-containing protein, partial [Tepiditoga sp.]|nr:GGDEF domain-containing protein [Tepiditoga sp.]